LTTHYVILSGPARNGYAIGVAGGAKDLRRIV